MTTDHDLEARMAAELSRRGGAVQGTPLTLDDIRGTARSITRRRRIAGGAAIAAVAAVALPAALLLGGSGDNARDIQPAPPPPAPVGQGTATYEGTSVTLPGGATVDLGLDAAKVSQFGVLNDGRVVVGTSTQGATSIRVYTATGDLQGDVRADTNEVVMGSTGETAAWVEPGGVIRVLDSGVEQPVTLATVPTSDDYLDLQAFAAEGCGAGDCRLLFVTSDGLQEATSDGVDAVETPGFSYVNDVSPAGDLWSVDFPAAGDGPGCTGLYDPESHEVVARECGESSYLTFSPDGEHVLGFANENGSLYGMRVYDRDLTLVREVDVTPDLMGALAWQDDSHLVGAQVTPDDSRWSLVRIGLDGTDEVLDGPVDGPSPELSTQWRFSE